MDKLLKRINELARKSKTEIGLTAEEKIEQKELRQQYIKNFRGSLNEILLNSTVYDPEGTDVTPEKLKQAQRQQSLEKAQEILASRNITFLDDGTITKKED
ncbi:MULTISPECIES: DUF896 domain-containing protein [unclassified Jeotgalibaca]|uniref:DUF896 domain-containing protein n=1 Tax=unclassified Jeotgalibaca TaxID=2621505 RepID=UPI003FD60402